MPKTTSYAVSFLPINYLSLGCFICHDLDNKLLRLEAVGVIEKRRGIFSSFSEIPIPHGEMFKGDDISDIQLEVGDLIWL